MSRELAHQILDDVKAGINVSEHLIRRALQATGDLGHEFPTIPDED